jgi:hypothetical protein
MAQTTARPQRLPKRRIGHYRNNLLVIDDGERLEANDRRVRIDTRKWIRRTKFMRLFL